MKNILFPFYNPQDPIGIACPYTRKSVCVEFCGVENLLRSLDQHTDSNAVIFKMGDDFHSRILEEIDSFNEGQSLKTSILFQREGRHFFSIFMGPYVEYLSLESQKYPYPEYHPRQYVEPLMVFLDVSDFRVDMQTSFGISGYETMKVLAMNFGAEVFDNVKLKWDFDWMDRQTLYIIENNSGYSDQELICCNNSYHRDRMGIFRYDLVERYYLSR